MDLMAPAKAAAEKMPATVNGTLLTLGTGLLAAATAALTAQQYALAAGLGVAGAALLFFREKLP